MLNSADVGYFRKVDLVPVTNPSPISQTFVIIGEQPRHAMLNTWNTTQNKWRCFQKRLNFIKSSINRPSDREEHGKMMIK